MIWELVSHVVLSASVGTDGDARWCPAGAGSHRNQFVVVAVVVVNCSGSWFTDWGAAHHRKGFRVRLVGRLGFSS